MFFRQFFDRSLAQHSYLIGCQKTGEAILIDPKRVLDEYINVAKQEGLKITHAAETHIHADYASGLRDVGLKCGATLYVSGEGGEDWQYENMPKDTVVVCDGDVFHVGNVVFEVIHTPGHTPESISFLLTDTGGGSEAPMGILTGDFLFVGDVGRPDLLEKAINVEGSAEIGAKDMFQSLKKLRQLPGFLQVWPGHGAGSACGKSLGAVPMSTLGYERENNWAFNVTEQREFVNQLTSSQPEPPTYFAEMKRVNKVGLPEFTIRNIATDVPNALTGQIIDLRDSDTFADGFIRGALNIPYDKNFLQQVGWYLDYSQPLTLIGDSNKSEQYQRDFASIGFDTIERIIDASDMDELINDQYEKVTPELFASKHQDVNVLDVRTLEEYMNGSVDGAVHRHHGTTLHADIPFSKDEDIYVHCKRGARSAIAVSALQQRGYTRAKNVLGGYDGFKDML